MRALLKISCSWGDEEGTAVLNRDRLVCIGVCVCVCALLKISCCRGDEEGTAVLNRDRLVCIYVSSAKDIL